MRKQTHKRKALGDVQRVLDGASSISDAARQLGVNRSSIHRWLKAGTVQMPTNAAPVADVAPTDTALRTEAVLGDARPGRDAPDHDRLWLALRREVFGALAGTRFDPRATLTLTGAPLARWKADRLAHVTERYRGDPRVLA